MNTERFTLAGERIRELKEDRILPPAVSGFFRKEAEFIGDVLSAYDLVLSGGLYLLSLEELRALNRSLYRKYFEPEPEFPELPRKSGQILRAMSAELSAMIPYAFDGDGENLLIRMELYLFFYQAFASAVSALDENDRSVINETPVYPSEKELGDILYYYVSDYLHFSTGERIRELLTMEEDLMTRRIRRDDLSDLRTLFFTGEYITENEEKTLTFLNDLPEETLRKMADTFTEGYRIGFEVTNKDLSKKKIVEVRYCAGFEPVVRIALENFGRMGLKPVIRRAHQNLLAGRSMYRSGFFGAVPSKQFDFDHKDDRALVLDRKLVTVMLEAAEEAYEKMKDNAPLYAGPAVMETFGAPPPELKVSEDAPKFSEAQQKMQVEFTSKASKIRERYIIEEERSFTIIAWPVPEIGERFPEIFREVIRLNTLDYSLYRTVQQKIIDALDRGEAVLVKGRNGNRTDLRISLHKLSNPEKETNFENCVADVNIPVGEVFTSPVLSGTEGVLHVSSVFLNELEFKELMLTIKDGMVTDYSCKNFETEQENRDYIRDNVLYHHETLPVGEFAIGTNTTAYVMAKKFRIGHVLPILIAEKTGPHLAFGDTCYSHEEKIRTFNPDGKEIIAKENECSIKREEDPMHAYFNCHTDVTIPFDELGEISVIAKDREMITIIEDGRFVLPGTEVLNDPLDEAFV